MPDVKLVRRANPIPVNAAPCSLSINVPKISPIPLDARIGRSRKATASTRPIGVTEKAAPSKIPINRTVIMIN
jgi:hypothetical protein